MEEQVKYSVDITQDFSDVTSEDIREEAQALNEAIAKGNFQEFSFNDSKKDKDGTS